MSIEPAPYGILYDNRGIRYIEVFNNGHVDEISNDRRSIEDKTEHSLYQAYFRAKRGECSIYFACNDENGNIYFFHANDLEALADSVGIVRPTDHVHNIRWTYSDDDPGNGRYAWLDVEFLCGCKLSSLNGRIMAKQLKELFGWEIILSSLNSFPASKCSIKVESRSIRDKPSK